MCLGKWVRRWKGSQIFGCSKFQLEWEPSPSLLLLDVLQTAGFLLPHVPLQRPGHFVQLSICRLGLNKDLGYNLSRFSCFFFLISFPCISKRKIYLYSISENSRLNCANGSSHLTKDLQGNVVKLNINKITTNCAKSIVTSTNVKISEGFLERSISVLIWKN